jgi:hypothetical protein
LKYFHVAGAVAMFALFGCSRATSIHPGADASQFEINSTMSMPSRTTQTVVFLNNLRSDCSVVDIPYGRVSDAPEHGQLSIVEMEDFPRYGFKSPLAACNSERKKGLRVTYTPNAVFVGKDRFSFDIFVNGRALHNHVIENVL